MATRRPNPQLSDPRSWYQLERWRRLRRHQLRTEPLCQMCQARGLAVPATVADHVTPHRGDWNAFLTGTLQSLCGHCHNSAKRRIDLGAPPRPYIGEDGYPLDTVATGRPRTA
jgi:5-methylcytosine-specific restriction enzyme A